MRNVAAALGYDVDAALLDPEERHLACRTGTVQRDRFMMYRS